MTDRIGLMTEHELKCWPVYFSAVLRGDKTFEVRKDDRGFKVGDMLWLREWHPEKGYTGAELRKRVTYALSGTSLGIAMGYVVMGLDQAESDLTALRQRHAELEAKLAHTHDLYRSAVEDADELSVTYNRVTEELRQRHAEAVEASFREGCFALLRAVDRYGQQTQDVDEAWETSEARKGVTT